MRWSAAATLTVALLAPVSGQATGDSLEDALAVLTPDMLARSMTALDDGMVQLDEGVAQLDDGITDVEALSTDGEEVVISLASDVLFDFDKADVSQRAEDKITALVADVPEGATVAVHGHTDSVGEPADNQELSEDRAATVAAVIGESRPDLQLEVKGFGEEAPVAPNEQGGNDNPEGRALNRRVEIRFEG